MKDPHLEIERKFLVREMPRGLEQLPHREIEQGYLVVSKKAQVRLRRYGRHYVLTFKRDAKVGREEREMKLTAQQFALLWPATTGARLTKIRYDAPWRKLKIEIDVYRGSNTGLVVAEVEFPDQATAQKFSPPVWLGAEITGVRRYSNIGLARD
ncbi:MAG: CYTH domain-containing protein [Chthoniobacterales bacterium]